MPYMRFIGCGARSLGAQTNSKGVHVRCFETKVLINEQTFQLRDPAYLQLSYIGYGLCCSIYLAPSKVHFKTPTIINALTIALTIADTAYIIALIIAYIIALYYCSDYCAYHCTNHCTYSCSYYCCLLLLLLLLLVLRTLLSLLLRGLLRDRCQGRGQ
jgi:hypothetical protein